MSIVIENLNYVYMSGGPYETKALSDVNLTIEDGEFVGLIGHTGSGKSTLVQHLNGLLMPSSGKIMVDGLDLADKKTDRRAIRRKVGLVFQYPENLLFEETVEKVRALGLDVPEMTDLSHMLRADGVDVRADVLTVDEMVEEVCRLSSSI